VIKNYFRTFAFGFIATFALACIGSGPAYGQQKTSPIPVPQPSTVTGTDPVPPPPPPNFVASKTASL
jgi:hypothetical protein